MNRNLKKRMHSFENTHDQVVMKGLRFVIRFDGRGFSKLTKESGDFEIPFDEKFCGWMVETAVQLMNSGVRSMIAYTQSDEISLLVHSDDNSWNRRVSKYLSILASEASVCFSLNYGKPVAFDARICPLITNEDVLDYFLWRNEDASRNALNTHCFWTLKNNGYSSDQAGKILHGLSNSQKQELLFREAKLNFNDLPIWQKRGILIYWKNHEIKGTNPINQKSETAIRRKIQINNEIPMRDDFRDFLIQCIHGF